MEGREGVKWELELACCALGKWDFGRWDWDLSQKKKPKWEWDWCFVSISVGSGHWLVGFGKKNGGWEMGLVTPLHDPLCRMLASDSISC